MRLYGAGLYSRRGGRDGRDDAVGEEAAASACSGHQGAGVCRGHGGTPPTVSGSLTQSQLKAKLEARKAEGEDVDVNREITAADLTTKDLTAGVAIDFSKKFNAAFAQHGTFKRVGDAAATTDTPADPGTKPGGDQKPGGELDG